jgi:hypothetical protein
MIIQHRKTKETDKQQKLLLLLVENYSTLVPFLHRESKTKRLLITTKQLVPVLAPFYAFARKFDSFFVSQSMSVIRGQKLRHGQETKLTRRYTDAFYSRLCLSPAFFLFVVTAPESNSPLAVTDCQHLLVLIRIPTHPTYVTLQTDQAHTHRSNGDARQSQFAGRKPKDVEA